MFVAFGNLGVKKTRVKEVSPGIKNCGQHSGYFFTLKKFTRSFLYI
jgi:hypothetical protein